MVERLQKLIARAGIASRRHAEQLILSGQVRVNGRVVTALGTKADPERDRIEAAGKLLRFPESNTYLILHKPTRVVSTMADPEGRRSLRHFLQGVSGRVFPVGRLDYAASGLILLTNDGELANQILKCAARLPQAYWIKVKGRLAPEQLERVARGAGARLRRLPGSPAAGKGSANPWYEVTLREASHDRLRRSLLRMGHPVEKMKRVGLATLELGRLPEGRHRPLDREELVRLRRAVAGAGQGAGIAAASGERSVL